MTKITAPSKLKRQIYSRDGWYVFFDPDNVKWVRVNEAGKEIIMNFEEDPNLENVVNHLTKKHQVDENKIMPFIDYLVKAGYLHKGDYQKKGINFDETSIFPGTIYLHPTYKCNLDCVYCYNKSDRDTHSHADGFSELSFRDYERLLKEIKELGVSGITFSGGEPLLRADLFQIAKMSKELGFYNSIITNGTLVSEKNIPDIIECFDNISISIDSCKEEENDMMRGKGTFKKTMAAIRLLLSSGVNISCLGVAHPQNLDSVAESYDFFINQMGCSSFVPQMFIPSSTMETTSQDTLDFFTRYSGVRHDINKANRIYEGTGLMYKNNCGMCTGELAIGADGGVFPCQSLLQEEFRGGNIKQESLRGILENSPVLKKMREVTVDTIEPCMECAIKYLCGGGCRAFHYDITGDINKTDRNACRISESILINSLFESTVQSNLDPPGQKKAGTKTEPTCL
ncbi:MAG: radical SAM protein [bacterium]|nr:radical SAM protein [bacterium]